MTKKPHRHENHDDRQSKGNATKKPPEGVVVDGLRDDICHKEPLHDDPHEGQNNQRKGNAITAFFFRELLRTEHAGRATRDMRQRHPHPGEPGITVLSPRWRLR